MKTPVVFLPSAPPLDVCLGGGLDFGFGRTEAVNCSTPMIPISVSQVVGSDWVAVLWPGPPSLPP